MEMETKQYAKLQMDHLLNADN